MPVFFTELELLLLLESSSGHRLPYLRELRLLITGFISLSKILFGHFKKIGEYQVRERLVYKTLFPFLS